MGLLKKVIHLEKEANPKTYSDLVRVIYEQGNTETMRTEGQAYAQKALELDPKCASAWLNQGVLQAKLEMNT
jgi:Zn-finger nucleic acid-binding protein